MNDTQFAEIAAWIKNAGLGGRDEAAIVTEFCARIVALGLPLARGQVFIDTLHPVYGGRDYHGKRPEAKQSPPNTVPPSRVNCSSVGDAARSIT